MSRVTLANAGNIVFLAFNGHKSGAPDSTRIDGIAAIEHLPPGQGVLDEDLLNRLNVKLRR